MHFKHSIGVIALLLGCQAGATVTDWADHGLLEVSVGVTPTGAFTDTIDFSLSDAAPLWVTTVANNLGPVLGIADGKISFFQHATSGTDVLLGSYDFSGTSGDTTRTFTPTGPGDFFYRITGTGTGASGGFYTVTSAPAAVPEPRTMTLALCGLVALAVASRRRPRSMR